MEIYKGPRSQAEATNNFWVARRPEHTYLQAMEVQRVLELHTGEETDWSTARGLKILDLGCGGVDGKPMNRSDVPLFAEYLGGNGAEVYGVDINPGYDGALYTHIQLDLISFSKTGRLRDIPGLQGVVFDIVHSSRFIGNLSLGKALESRLNDFDIATFRDLMLEQSMEITKEGGLVRLGGQNFCVVDGFPSPIVPHEGPKAGVVNMDWEL